MTRVCTKCGVEYEATLEFFYAAPLGQYGLMARCKTCHAAYYMKHREEIRAKGAVYRVANREKIAAQRAVQYAACPGPARARAAAYRETHPPDPAYHAAYYATHRDELLAYSKGYAPVWRAANPEKSREIVRRRRSLEANAPGTHTSADIRNIYAEQGGRCFWCDCELDDGYHVDHLEPLSRGGSDGPENLAVACPTCNFQKAAQDPMVFLEKKLGEMAPPNLARR